MTVKPSDIKNFIVSGVFIVVGLIVAMIFIFMLSSESAFLAPKFSLNASVENAQNLKRGAAVQLRGIRVGSVSNIEITGISEIKVTASIDARHREWIKKDSYFSFRTQGVLGDRYLEILGGSHDSPMAKDGDSLSVKDDSPIDMFINRGEDLMIVAGRVLQRLDVILENVEEDSIGKLIENLTQTSEGLHRFTHTLEQTGVQEFFTNMNRTSQELEKTTQSISRITHQIEDGPGTLNSLIYDNTLHQDIQTLMGGAQRNRLLQFFIRESIKQSED